MDPSLGLAVYGGQWLLGETGAAGMVGQETVLWGCPACPSTSRSMMGVYDGSVPPTWLSQEKQRPRYCKAISVGHWEVGEASRRPPW